ncbi:SitI3 family protein [Actinoplanes sp. TFC3]|uniref:SitI3 family protein n=1 Tax=Actinoplanes sp. TFC3 TaxID=1710355 RepID=UPI00082FE4E8|nr:SitI3 family protein [Actinoplanes sp. TFC3]
MAEEYDWRGDTAVDVSDLRRFIAAATGGELRDDDTIFLPGMYVTSRQPAGDEVNPAMRLFGFDDRFSATFRFSSRVDQKTSAHAASLMVHAVIAFALQREGRGVLLFNGETAVLQYDGSDVVLDAEWEDWSENSEIAPLLTQFATQVLPQPLL